MASKIMVYPGLKSHYFQVPCWGYLSKAQGERILVVGQSEGWARRCRCATCRSLVGRQIMTETENRRHKLTERGEKIYAQLQEWKTEQDVA
jgi:hypothetical protein